MKRLRVHIISENFRLVRELETSSEFEVSNSSSPEVMVPNSESVEVLVCENVHSPGSIRNLAGVYPNAAILLAGRNHDRDFFPFLVSGVHSVALANESFRPAVLRTAEGKSTLTTPLAARIQAHFQNEGPARHTPGALSFLEQDILDHLAKGFTINEAAGALELSPSELCLHARRIIVKLQKHPPRSLFPRD